MSALPDLTAEPRALRVVKRPLPVAVRFAAADGVCATLEGPVRYLAGDALLTGVQGEQWPVGRALFLASYAPLPPTRAGEDGSYLKHPAEALALRLTQPLAVPVGSHGDMLHGQPGAWLLRHADGSLGVVQDPIFRATYGAAPGEARWPAG